MVHSIVRELEIRRDYLKNAPVNTIYFGGGTPSILNSGLFSQIFEIINCFYVVDKNAEITFEANPDDLTPEYLNSIRQLPFNRISIGIQSFDNSDLQRINRRHSGKQAIDAVHNAQNAGFDNISIDLIYGLPLQTITAWESQIDIALELGVQHISAYGLTYEEGTALWKQQESGKVTPVGEDTMVDMYRLLVTKMQENGFEAYEISNFAQKGFRSRHNTSYWQQEPYLGVGPSAHSYDGTSRQWNIASITNYINALKETKVYYEKETLSLNDKYNDFIMVRLRTSDGLNIQLLEDNFGAKYKNYLLKEVQKYTDTGKATLANGILRLTTDGFLISNLIISELMKV